MSAVTVRSRGALIAIGNGVCFAMKRIGTRGDCFTNFTWHACMHG